MTKQTRILDIAALVLVVLLVGFMLAPAVARLQRSPAEAKCQSNLRQWSRAMALYCGDNHGRYPTNRRTLSSQVDYQVQLTPDGQLNPDGTPKRFLNGVSWVEALYPYIQASATKTGQDWKALRRCPSALDWGQKPGGSLLPTSYITYALNYNLVECPESLVRSPGSLMMLREMDRRVNSLLRPANLSGDGATTPNEAFLDASDVYEVVPSTTDPNRHGAGSYIAFADGHVRYFTMDYYPQKCAWDPDTQRWYNFFYANPTTATERRLNKSIAVTP